MAVKWKCAAKQLPHSVVNKITPELSQVQLKLITMTGPGSTPNSQYRNRNKPTVHYLPKYAPLFNITFQIYICTCT